MVELLIILLTFEFVIRPTRLIIALIFLRGLQSDFRVAVHAFGQDPHPVSEELYHHHHEVVAAREVVLVRDVLLHLLVLVAQVPQELEDELDALDLKPVLAVDLVPEVDGLLVLDVLRLVDNELRLQVLTEPLEEVPRAALLCEVRVEERLQVLAVLEDAGEQPEALGLHLLELVDVRELLADLAQQTESFSDDAVEYAGLEILGPKPERIARLVVLIFLIVFVCAVCLFRVPDSPVALAQIEHVQSLDLVREHPLHEPERVDIKEQILGYTALLDGLAAPLAESSELVSDRLEHLEALLVVDLLLEVEHAIAIELIDGLVLLAEVVDEVLVRNDQEELILQVLQIARVRFSN